ncbi:sugar transferase [Paracoccus sp. Z330]|uniref:Sugar transferase n=1 Tax=Paracoccus onchidii TaxID=3017813 RepID=A0ABT4ZBX0_9RHOB|nr:sugar transferase [Paracoccus onchidii]MDB6176856.1 sugar transferase [Paracoccus onchidii]
MTIHHDWDKTQAQRLAALTAPKMAWFIREASADGINPMPASKRIFDVALVLILLVPLSLVMVTVALILLVVQGRPIFYSAQRMSSPSRSFTQLKFRTMLRQDGDFGATGAHKHWRITPIGHFLRRTRIDELPQLFNILRGDMSFVGPRPPLREYVERFPAVYSQVLKSRPGVTGLATLIYHRHEDKILAGCTSAEATEAAYYRRCLPAKLKIDLIYQRHRNMRMDVWILWSTVKIVVSRRDERPRRRKPVAPRKQVG